MDEPLILSKLHQASDEWINELSKTADNLLVVSKNTQGNFADASDQAVKKGWVLSDCCIVHPKSTFENCNTHKLFFIIFLFWWEIGCSDYLIVIEKFETI
jgi:hypothetical protein